MTYPNPDGSSYNRGRPTKSKNTTSDYGATGPDMERSHGNPDKWTAQLLDKLGGDTTATKPSNDGTSY